MTALSHMLTVTDLHIKLRSDHMYNREKSGNLINNSDIFWVTEWLKGRDKCFGNKQHKRFNFSVFKQIFPGTDYVRSCLVPTAISFQKTFKNTINALNIATAECVQWFNTMYVVISAIRKSLYHSSHLLLHI
jgi:hypothetical protein